MSHEINSAIDTVYVPNNPAWDSTWHKLETVTEEEKIASDGSNIPLVFNPIIECGIVPQFGEEMEITEEVANEIKNWKLISADCRKGKSGKIHPLHIPKESYGIHQNRQLFDAMVNGTTEVLGNNGFDIVTVGTLGSYSQFFLSIAVKGNSEFNVGENDTWKKFFNLISSHDARFPSQFMQSLIRMVCANTVQASVAESEGTGENTKIKHSRHSAELITAKLIADSLEAWISQNQDFERSMVVLKSASMTPEQFRSFAAGVFTQHSSDVISTTSTNRVDEMVSLFVRGKGNSGESFYDAYNAFTEYFTHGNGIGKKASDAQKIARANYGKGNDWKIEALRILTNEESFKEAIERGERLLNDRLAVQIIKDKKS